VRFCHDNKLVICADEVYQKNIYGSKPFVSVKKTMHEMGAPYNQTEVISFHSTSKGLLGECGLRGGYMELENLDPYAQGQILKLRTITLCPNTVGQLMVILHSFIFVD
jgi:aspartate/methionine/tyrosine aminotransferase